MKALGMDIGTTTISAIVVDGGAKEAEKVITIGNPGFIPTEHPWEKQQDPAGILKEVRRIADQLLEECPGIGVIGLTGQMHGIVYTDAEGKHVSPLYTWQDGSGDQLLPCGKSICEILKERCGVQIYTGYGLATYFYHVMTAQVPEAAVSLCTIADYAGMVLTGRKSPWMHSSNAASLGMYDAREGQFQNELFERIMEELSQEKTKAWKSQNETESVRKSEDETCKNAGSSFCILPEVTGKLQVLGTYRQIPVCTAIGDNQAGFLGAVKEIRNSVLVNMGTGGQVSVYSDQYCTGEGIEARPFVNEGYLLAGSSLCGGRAYAMLADFFVQCAEALGVEETDPYAVMERFLRTECSAEKLKVDTRFSGTRERPFQRGSIRNIGTENFTPAALTRGILEGMADELYQMYRQMGENAISGKTKLVASGNGLRKNRALQECMSWCFSMELRLAEQEEEAAYGAALAGITFLSSGQSER